MVWLQSYNYLPILYSICSRGGCLWYWALSKSAEQSCVGDHWNCPSALLDKKSKHLKNYSHCDVCKKKKLKLAANIFRISQKFHLAVFSIIIIWLILVIHYIMITDIICYVIRIKLPIVWMYCSALHSDADSWLIYYNHLNILVARFLERVSRGYTSGIGGVDKYSWIVKGSTEGNTETWGWRIYIVSNF